MSTVVLLFLSGCAPPAPEADGPIADVAPVVDAASADPVVAEAQAAQEALTAAQGAARKLGTSLKGRLSSAMQSDGPKGAVTACADEAQGMTALATAGSRARAGRAALKLRNPANANAPEWVKQWLDEQGHRSAEGVRGISETHRDGDAMVARVLKPIPVEGVCLTCHGDPAAIPEEVKAALAERYPADQATGYALGDLRGALWAEARAPLDAP
ncbi:MAG: DUF3365 domain-containing protein [Myxococcota bacterium]